MIINGLERGFLLGIGAAAELSKLCPGDDLNKLGELFTGWGATAEITMKMALLMNRCYEDSKSLSEPGYKPQYLTWKELQVMRPVDLDKLGDEVIKAYKEGMDISVKTEEAPVKKTEGEVEL